VSYVDAGYSIALSVLFLYAVALVLRRRRWERAMRVAERTMHAEHPERIEAAKIAEVTQVIAHTEAVEVTEIIVHTEDVEVIAHAEHAEHAEEQTAPGARS
jgi:hypothetical protein